MTARREKGKKPTEGMPDQGMGSPGESAAEMPGKTMADYTEGADDMPTRGMNEASKSRSDMPRLAMGNGHLEANRFRSGDGPPNPTPESLEPGVVEVEFREGVSPQILAGARGASEITTPGEADLGRLNEILQEHRLEQAEPSFDTSEDEAAEAQSVARERGYTVPHFGNFVTLHFPPETDTLRVADELAQLPDVERAVAVPKAIPPSTPLSEPLVGSSDQVVLDPATGLENQWYIFRCNIDDAWNLASGDGAVIADIDWGYRTSHQDLSTRLDMAHAFNAFDGGTNVSTGGSVSHGTAVMGIAGGADNNLGMAGIAFDASLWPVQADSGPGTALGGNAWARAIDWVRTTDSGGRRKIINLEVQTGTFGNFEMVPSVNAAIRTAIAHGVVVCVAAGNGDRDAGMDDTGGAIPETGSILVGATEYHPTENRRASFSNFGSRVVVCAPGDSSHDLTASSSSDTAYRNGFGGTSGATPKVAGTVALMLDVNPGLTHDQVRTILNTTGSAVVTDSTKPVGTFLNAEAAVRAASRARPSGPVVSWTTNRLDAFVIGTDSALYHKWFDGSGWGPSLTGYEAMGGVITSDPEVVSWGANRLDVFVTGTDRALYHKWFDGAGWGPSLTGYEGMGGIIIGNPEAVSWGANRLDVFVIGTDSALYHKWFDGSGWGPSLTGYEAMGGVITSDPEVVSWGPNRLDTFVVGTDSALYHKWFDGFGWGPSLTGYEPMGGIIVGTPRVVSWGPNRLDVFVIGTDHGLYHKWFDGSGWGPSLTGYEAMGGVITSDPEVVSWGPNRLDVFVTGTDQQLYHKWFDGSGWGPSLTGWEPMGGTIVGTPRVVSWGPSRLDVFAIGTDSALYHKWFDGSGWGPSLTGWEAMGGIITRF